VILSNIKYRAYNCKIYIFSIKLSFMKFPEYSAYPDRREELVSAYVGFVARRENLSRGELETLPDASIRRSALEIGRGCMAIAHRNERRGDTILTTVRQRSGRFVDVPRNSYERDQRTQYRTAGLILARRDSERIVAAQRLIHLETIDELKRSWDFYQNNWIDLYYREAEKLRGNVAEYTATGLFTRLAHPWMIALSSLPHHNKSATYTAEHNIDTVVIETGPYTTEQPTVSRIQTKALCLGICEDPIKQQIKRDDYHPDVTFISGHCDLQISCDRYGDMKSPYTDLLIAEVEGTATPDDIQKLDALTNHLLFNMDDPRRQGTFDPAVAALAYAGVH
jgi:hypothetical protein